MAKLFIRTLVARHQLLRGLAVSFVLVCAAPAYAQEITMLNGDLRFNLPAGFSRLSDDEIRSKYQGGGRPPMVAYGDAQRNVRIGFNLSKTQQPLSDGRLEEAKAAFEDLFPRMIPGFRWNDRRMVSFGGKRWVFFDFGSEGPQGPKRNHMYITTYRGDMLSISGAAPLSDWPTAQQPLNDGIRSIRLTLNN